jgi:hypothetical protein
MPLMTEFVIKINKHEFYFTEIEFYCKTVAPKENVHNDLYVHGDDLQKEFGKWYFHGSGLDLTFGNTNYYGGILVRGVKIKTGKDWEYISGPQKVIKKLFSKIHNVGEKSTFHLEHKEDNKVENQEVYFSTRVGLNPKISETFFSKKYRAITDISSKHPFKEKENVYKVLKENSKYKEEELIKLFGYRIK